MDRFDEKFWYGLIAVGTAVELDALRHQRADGTLSHALRKAARTETRMGRVALRFAVGALAVWLVPHLCEQVADSIEP